MDAREQVIACFEKCAEAAGDINDAVFERFFALDEQAAQLMLHSDVHMRGRMLDQTLELLMTDEHFGPEGYLAWELDNHLDAYRATPAMYEAFFAAIEAVLADSLGNQWRTEDTQAWRSRVDLVMQQVYAHTKAAAVG